MPLKVYVAGGWKFRLEIQAVRNVVAAMHNVQVVSNWIGRENGINTPAELRIAADADIAEVTESDVVLAVMTDDKYEYRGTFSELGCAFGQGKTVIIICPGIGEEKVADKTWSYTHYCMANVFFWHHLAIHVQSVNEAIAVLQHLSKSKEFIDNLRDIARRLADGRRSVVEELEGAQSGAGAGAGSNPESSGILRFWTPALQSQFGRPEFVDSGTNSSRPSENDPPTNSSGKSSLFE